MEWGVPLASTKPMEIPEQGCKCSPLSQTGELSSPDTSEAPPSSLGNLPLPSQVRTKPPLLL